jgi:hypothetical protein
VRHELGVLLKGRDCPDQPWYPSRDSNVKILNLADVSTFLQNSPTATPVRHVLILFTFPLLTFGYCAPRQGEYLAYRHAGSVDEHFLRRS